MESLPLKGILALSPEEIHMGFKLQFEDVVLLDAIGFHWGADCVAQKWQTGQWIIILKSSQVVQVLGTSHLFLTNPETPARQNRLPVYFKIIFLHFSVHYGTNIKSAILGMSM